MKGFRDLGLGSRAHLPPGFQIQDPPPSRTLFVFIFISQMRALPGALPAVAPFDNVGTRQAVPAGEGAPNIVKDGTPARGAVIGLPFAPAY